MGKWWGEERKVESVILGFNENFLIGEEWGSLMVFMEFSYFEI